MERRQASAMLFARGPEAGAGLTRVAARPAPGPGERERARSRCDRVGARRAEARVGGSRHMLVCAAAGRGMCAWVRRRRQPPPACGGRSARSLAGLVLVAPRCVNSLFLGEGSGSQLLKKIRIIMNKRCLCNGVWDDCARSVAGPLVGARLQREFPRGFPNIEHD